MDLTSLDEDRRRRLSLMVMVWILGAVVFYPGLDAPSMDRLAGTWIAAASGGVAGVALLTLAADGIRERRAQSGKPAPVAGRAH